MDITVAYTVGFMVFNKPSFQEGGGGSALLLSFVIERICFFACSFQVTLTFQKNGHYSCIYSGVHGIQQTIISGGGGGGGAH